MEKHITVGIAGHVDHGKTSLVRCLTGIDTDRLEEEKRRGLSIESGIAPFELESGTQIALVDVPGHKDFLKNTIRGLSSVDAGILVVAADGGVMPQTLEHLQILEFFGAKDGFMVLSKADLVDEETLELAELEIWEAIEGTFLDGKPVVHFSAIDRRGSNEIRAQIEEMISAVPSKDKQSPFRLWIDEIISFAGFGTVVSGTILSGTLGQDDPLEVLPSGIDTRARSLETHHSNVSEAIAGQRVGINLHKVSVNDVARGMVVAQPKTIHPSYFLNVDLKILDAAKKPVNNRQRVKVYLGTSVTNSLVVFMEKERLDSGERGLAQFRLMRPVAALPRDPFVICPLNVQTAMGGGTVLEIPQMKYREGKASTMIPFLKALQENNLGECIEYAFKSNLSRPIKINELARNMGFPLHAVEAEIKERVRNGELLLFKGSGVLSKELYKKIKDSLPGIVERVLKKDPLKTNVNADEIKGQLTSSIDDVPFKRMLAELCNERKLIKVDGGFRGQDISVDLPPQQAQIVSHILDYARESGFRPFSADTIWKLHKKKFVKEEIKKLLSYLRNQKRLVRLNDGRFLSSLSIEQIKEKVRAVILQNGTFTLADIKETFGYGRTVGVPVFEYLDSIGFTRREEDGRVLR